MRTTALTRKLHGAERRKRLTALLLLAPALLLMTFAFVVPIGALLTNAVHAPEFVQTAPRLAAALRDWDGEDLPPESVFALLVEEFGVAYADKSLARASTRLNYAMPGLRSLAMKTGRRAERLRPPYRDALVAGLPRWGELATWRALKSASSPYTEHFLLQALDLERTEAGAIARVDAQQQVYLNRLAVTFWISLVVTACCALIGYPMAYVVASAGARRGRLLLLLVLLPFWTSLLVRT
ncbi:MAG: ABC transporter permease, partial [Gammaproteobacteria bacterium]|nr:ABC transporter permease [Gammaproteobacteria bacterium]